jgi:hypothetical protein
MTFKIEIRELNTKFYEDKTFAIKIVSSGILANVYFTCDNNSRALYYKRISDFLESFKRDETPELILGELYISTRGKIVITYISDNVNEPDCEFTLEHIVNVKTELIDALEELLSKFHPYPYGVNH